MKSPLVTIREWHEKIRRQSEDRVFRRLFKTMAKANEVSFGRIHICGTVTAAARAYYRMLDRPTARADLLHILEYGNAVAKCYALAGLFEREEPDFREIAKAYIEDPARILYMPEGCVGYHITIGDFIDHHSRTMRSENVESIRVANRRLP